MWRSTVLTIFPEMFPGPLGTSLAGKALASGLWSLDAVDIRGYATDKNRTVDDTPAGGGRGMVMKADVLARAIDASASDGRPRLLMSPRGKPLTQARVATLAKGDGVTILCGRFEGVDERLIAARNLEEVSVPTLLSRRAMYFARGWRRSTPLAFRSPGPSVWGQ